MCRDLFRCARHVDAQFGRLVAVVAVELAGGAFGLEDQRVLVDRSAELRVGVFAVEVSLRVAVVVIFQRLRAVLGVDLVNAQIFAHFRGIVVGVGHRNDGVCLDQHGKFPEGGIEMVDDASTFVAIAGEVVDPCALWQVNAVAAVIAFRIGSRVLVDGRHQEGITVHILILCTFAERVVILLLHEHRANHRSTVDRHGRCRVGIGHEFAFQFEIPAVERRALAAECLRIFGIGAPSVHVEFHGREGLPLEFAHIDGNIFTAEDTVKVGGDVRLSGKAGTDESGDVETNVFPIAACLVAAPNTGIALCACPAVERNDEGTGVVAVLGHDATDVGHTVQTEGVTPADPCHVCFEHADTGVAHLLDDVALQEGFDAVFGVKIALRPQSDFHTFGAGVISECFEVLDVAVECRRLSVAGAVAVVGEEPAEGHVIVEIAIDGSARRELIIVEFAVETFANAAIVLLAFVVGLTILHFHEALAIFCLRPVVAVVGVEVTLIETEFRQQHGVSGELIEAAE